MEWVIVFAVIAAVVFGARAVWRKADDLMPQKPSTVARTARVKDEPAKVSLPLPESAVDLTTSDGIRSRVAGSSHWVDSSALEKFNGTVFYLRREPTNKYDSNAVAIYAGTRKIGYVSATQAEKYSSLLDQLGNEFVVTRDTDFFAGDEYFLPRIPALRKLVKDGASVFDRANHPTLTAPIPPLADPPRELTGGYPKLGGPHRNGDRIYGFASGYAREMSEAGTPTVSRLTKRSIKPAISDVRIGDRLLIVRDNGKLRAEKAGEPVGELSWDWDHRSGVLEVQRVFVSKDNAVVNCAGIAIPGQ